MRWECEKCSTLNPGRVKNSNLDLNSGYVGILYESGNQPNHDGESLEIFPLAIDLSTPTLSDISSIMKKNVCQIL